MANTRHSYQRGYGFATYDPATSPMWANFPNVHDFGKVFGFNEDFTAFNVGDTATWTLVQTNGTAQQTNTLGGGVTLACSATDNDTATLWRKGDAQSSGGGIFQMDPDSGLKLWWEMQFAVDDIAEFGVCAGLGTPDATAEAVADNTLIINAAAIVDGVYIETGAAGASATVNFASIKDGTAGTEHKADAITLTADLTEYHTVGFYFDGADTVEFWADGALSASITPSGEADWPDNELLIPFVGCKVGTTDAGNLAVRSMRCWQYRS